MTDIVVFVLDTTTGKPAAGVPVTLERERKDTTWEVVASTCTDTSGCIPVFVPPMTQLVPGHYRLTYSIATYFATTGRPCFFPEAVHQFRLAADERYVLPLLISPFSHSTYRGTSSAP